VCERERERERERKAAMEWSYRTRSSFAHPSLPFKPHPAALVREGKRQAVYGSMCAAAQHRYWSRSKDNNEFFFRSSGEKGRENLGKRWEKFVDIN
jgi:hypothetical protein